MTNLDSLSTLAQANESSIGFQSGLIFGGLVITVLTVLVVQGGLYLAHRANWWQSDAPDAPYESERPLSLPTLAETEDLHEEPGRQAAVDDSRRSGRTPRRRTA